MDSDTVSILIADKNKSFIEGLIVLLSQNKNFQILGATTDGELLQENKNLYFATVLLIDIEVLGPEWYTLASRINYNFPQLKMIALSMHWEGIHLPDVIKAGFLGYVNKPDVAVSLFQTIEEVLDGKYVFPAPLKEQAYNM